MVKWLNLLFTNNTQIWKGRDSIIAKLSKLVIEC